MEHVVFCHGIPGGPGDAELFRRANPNATTHALNLLDADPSKLDVGLQAALDTALDDAPVERVTLVGFSIGAMAAIRLAAMRPESVSRLALISPAAPLALGDFLANMAGRPVFELALKAPPLFRIAVRIQGLIARISPTTLIKVLFAGCGPSERELLEDPAFRNVLARGLAASLVSNPDVYRALVSAYVADWEDLLPLITCPVDLWHGTKDTWTPPAMSKALADAFQGQTSLTLIEDAEHYSTLTRAVL